MAEPFFVKIDDSVEFRRQLLESSRVILERLKRYEDFYEFLNEKKELAFRLRKNLNEINTLVSGLQKELPASRLSNFEKKPREKPKLVLEKTKPSKLDELEKELENIETRLKRLA